MSVVGGRRAAWPMLLVAAFLLPATATAEPSIWDKAHNPRAERAAHVLHAVERMIQRSDDAAFNPDMQANFTRSALAMLELAGASELPDVRLRFLLGGLLGDPRIARYNEAETLLRRALKESPHHPLASRAWFDLAIVEAKLHKPKLEIDAYNHALALTWQPQARANILMNRGESQMVIGKLPLAIADYRRAIRISQHPELRALGYYGLGIALERSGDLPSALDAMHEANSIRTPMGSALNLPTVFFVPAYEIYYYYALAYMARARDAKKPAREVTYLEHAIVSWQRYLAGAEPDRHKWVQHAKLLLKSCRRKHDRVKTRVAPRRRSAHAR